ncbi:cryptochrome/photolyase family protein [Pseudoalteromonas spongiae]|uniref:cryptochrome/photolyase family protein n=1 Tax=Pseudoalteromonas spongiae TaxID=298657 RepID=UPI00026CCD42|nr:cryptochrome/photolyase family protein [Pseudoalteromonas spongiae]ATD00245.1 deoxyribodipyrimidine photolyase-related protein [Pseudoalteromonas spongiae UST010723-006]
MTSELRLILGDQLNAQHSWFKEKSHNVTYVIAELYQEASYTTHHIQKISAFFAAMHAFAGALEKAGHKVIYLTLDDTQKYADLPDLLNHLIKEHGIHTFCYQLPDEYRLRAQLTDYCQSLSIDYKVFDTEHFYLADNQLASYFKHGKKHRLEHFYRKMRVEFNLLMNGDEPLTGQWNFDSQNRNKLKASDLADIPEPLVFANDVSDILARIERHGIKTMGKAEKQLLWPINRSQAKQLLAFFCKTLLPKFGQFQDAMTGKLIEFGEDKGWSLYHSRLSFAINAKMISPHCVVNAAIETFEQNDDIDIAQVEGFVRQILGWREFVRGIYWANMPNYASLNALDAKLPLPSWFWSGNTKMRCLFHAITQSLDYAYAHHIQRLMVTGNFCLIAGIHPDEVDDWYLGIYIDALEWVEMPNTRGMSQFADGGIVGSKAYAASGNYIKKMSDYCSDCHYNVANTVGDDACPLNSLYWQFMDKHKDSFTNNPRTKMVLSNWLKKPQGDRDKVLSRANFLLQNLENL